MTDPAASTPPPGGRGPGRLVPILGVVVAVGIGVFGLTRIGSAPGPDDTSPLAPAEDVSEGEVLVAGVGNWARTVVPGFATGGDVATDGRRWMLLEGGATATDATVWASDDGVTFVPFFDTALSGTRPGMVAAVDGGGWVIATDPVSGWTATPADPVRLWWSPDGRGFSQVPAPGLDGVWLNRVSVASRDGAVVVVFEDDLLDGVGLTIGSTDGGLTWERVALQGRAVTAAAIGDDLVVVGSDDTGAPALWRRSTGWTPEPHPELTDGRHPNAGFVTLVEIPSGGYLATAGSVDSRGGARWLRSDDLDHWTEFDPPIERWVRLSRIGDLLLATPSSTAGPMAISADGVTWSDVRSTVVDPTWGGRGAGSGDQTIVIGPNADDGLTVVSAKPIEFHAAESVAGRWVEGDPIEGVVDGGGISGDAAVLVVGDSLLRLSPNGDQSVLEAPPGSGLDVALAYPDLVVDTTDGRFRFDDGTWEPCPAPDGGSRGELLYTGDGYVTVVRGPAGYLRHASEDGCSWSGGAEVPLEDVSGLVAFDGLGFMAFTRSDVLVSHDGLDWNETRPIDDPTSMTAWFVTATAPGEVTVDLASGPAGFPIPEGFVVDGVRPGTDLTVVLFGWVDGVPTAVATRRDGVVAVAPLGLAAGGGPEGWSVVSIGGRLLGLVPVDEHTTRVWVWEPAR